MSAILPLALVEKCIGARIWVIMRDETEFIGTLKGFDDYVNIVLEDVCEIHTSEEGVRREVKMVEKSILLNGSAVTLLVPGGPNNGASE